MGARFLPMEMTAEEALEACHRVWEWSGCVAVIRGFGARHVELLRAEATGTRAQAVRVQVDKWEPVTEAEAGLPREGRDFSEAMLREELSADSADFRGLSDWEEVSRRDAEDRAPIEAIKTLLQKPPMNCTDTPSPDTSPPTSTPVPPGSALFKTDLQAVGLRMREARKACGWDGYGMKTKFAVHIGIDPKRYEFAELGRGVLLHVDAVAEGLNARAEWLRTGEGEIFMASGPRMKGREAESQSPQVEGPPGELDDTQERMMAWLVASGALGATREECLDRVITSGLLFELGRVRLAGLLN